MEADLLERVLAPNPPPFALIHRVDAARRDVVDIVIGDVTSEDELAAVDRPLGAVPSAGHELLVLIPYRQLAERGFACVDDGAPLRVMRVREQGTVALFEVLARLPLTTPRVEDAGFDVDDAAYAAKVRAIVAGEIGRGEGANFVLKRCYSTRIVDYTPRDALSIFRRLLEREAGAYWTFLFHDGERTLVGATPERHLTLRQGKLSMNPISGTYRYPASGPTLSGVLEFLRDTKESEELYMVVDEELKMMARLCEGGGRLAGPSLKEMSNLAHTEYFIEGNTSREIGELLRETMFAPTVVGSPLESACRIIERHEPGGRSYYSGVLALVGRDERGARTLDSAILIRTAEIDAAGRMRIGVGATIVRHSDPESEAHETRAKASGLLAALGARPPVRYAGHPDVTRILDERNRRIARFWFEQETLGDGDPALSGARVLVVDAEDNFTSMLQHQLGSFGLDVELKRFDDDYRLDAYDLVVMGPGPGDPEDVSDPRIARLHRNVRWLLSAQQPFLAVCLSHQILSHLLGLPLERREKPNQGVQREIDLFGQRVSVGFYNTFSARCDFPAFRPLGHSGMVKVAREIATGEVHALSGGWFRSLQFHPESILSLDGASVLKTFVQELLSNRTPPLRAVGQ